MTWSAPRARTRSTFAVLHTPVTSAPNAFAICTAKLPTPPDAPMISTFSPGLDAPVVADGLQRGEPGDGDGGRLLEGEVRRLRRRACRLGRAAYSAKVPSPMPNTSSPGAKPVTSAPTASTVPARLRPGLAYFGRRRPKPASRMG